MTPLLPLPEAQQRLLALAGRLPSEHLNVRSANGRYLAEPLIAQRTQPPADLSSMDGYAINGEGPWTLVGESRGGLPFTGMLKAGEATQISTGAVMPVGADRVLIQENAEIDDRRLSANTQPHTGQYIRRAGFDFNSGDELLREANPIGPAQVALTLSAGLASIATYRLPRIALIEGGDELVADPSRTDANSIPASNNAMIEAMTQGMVSSVQAVGPVPDKLDALMAAIKNAHEADVIVTSGGASVGRHDLVQPALETLGAKLDFWRVAIKPGKPLLVATLGRQIIIGLPGNPVSSYVTAFLFLLPLLRHMAGAREPFPNCVSARLMKSLPANGPRRQFLRATWDGSTVTALNEQDSSALRALAAANVLIERPEHCNETEAGTYVPIYPIQNGGIA